MLKPAERLTFYIFLLGAWVFWASPSWSDDGVHPRLKNLYKALQLPLSSQVSDIDLLEAYRDATGPGSKLSPEQKARAAGAYYVLTHSELREQVKAGKPLEIDVAPEEREALSRLLSEINPSWGKRLKQYGKVPIEHLNSAAAFYIAAGLHSAHTSHSTDDPLYFRHYMESLRTVEMHRGFATFVGASWFTSSGLSKIPGLKKSVAGQIFISSTSLAAGALTSEYTEELRYLPEYQALQEARKIKDPKEREKKVAEAEKQLHAVTWGSDEWRVEKAAGITALIVSSLASNAVFSVVQSIPQKVLDRYLEAKKSGKPLRFSDCMIVSMGLASKAFTGPTRTGKMGGTLRLLHRGALEIPKLVLFMSIDSAIREPITDVWFSATIDRDLQDRRRTLQNAFDDAIKNASPENEKKALNLLREQSHLWNAYRRRKMSEPEGIMSMHAMELDQFNDEVEKPLAIYKWFVEGFREDDPLWEDLQRYYFGVDATESEVKEQLLPYLRAFFCGPKPKDGFEGSRKSLKVTPFRVVDDIDPRHCKMSYEELKKVIQSGDYVYELRLKSAEYQVQVHPVRIERIDFYEKRVLESLMDALGRSEHPRVGPSSLPGTILGALEAELQDLEKLKSPGISPKLQQILEDKIVEVKEMQSSAIQLLKYYQTPLLEREAPDRQLEELFELLDPSQDEEWRRAARYYRSFILR